MKKICCAALLIASVLALLGSFSVAAESASLPLVGFSADDLAHRVAASSPQVTFTSVADPSGGQLDVAVAGGKDAYPGVTIKPQGPAWDLSKFGHVDVRVANTGAKTIFVTARVDNEGDWKLNPYNAANATIKPGATDTVRVRFGYSWGRRAYALNAARVARVLVFVGKSDGPQSFRIEAVQAGGAPGEQPAVPPDQIRTKLPGGVVLGAGSHLDAKKQIKATHADAELVAGTAGQSLQVTVSKNAAYAGVLIKPVIGRWDMRQDTQAIISARNIGKTPVQFRVRLESAGGDSQWVSADAGPGEARQIVLPFAGTSLWTGGRDTGPRFNSDAATGAAIELAPGNDDRQLLVDSVVASLAPAPAIPAWLGKRPPVEGKWTQTLDENFDEPSINSSIWDFYGENYWDHRQSHFSKDDVILGGGVVRLRFAKKSGHQNDDPKRFSSDYATGYLTSFGKWTQRYGYFEARMKLPTAPGLWPAFWMMPDRGPAAGTGRGSTADGGMEFDIMEYLTRYGPHRYNIAMHWDGYGKQHKSTGTEHIYFQPDKDGFVTSGLLWEPGRLTFYCNGAKVAVWDNPRVSSVPAYIMFTLPCGGWGGNDLTGAGLPDDFVIDWVRAWQRDDLAAAPKH